MKKFYLVAVATIACAVGQRVHADTDTPHVKLTTNMGAIVLELDAQRAPLTVKNFLQYVRDKHYDNTIFHRVIQNFVIQGGGYTDKNIEKPTRSSVPNESGNGLSNRRGTIGLARTGDPHSGTSQFYINLGDNVALDPQPSRWGYTVFGHVIEGMEVAQKISEVATSTVGQLQDTPVKQVIIQKAEIVE
ncbi:MAG TPA: peptidylprolyl isomerase [Steroidobacteraceae bacterium]|nr:peptidylprolyl isomerase [Steroidobacteraceae bacterium]